MNPLTVTLSKMDKGINGHGKGARIMFPNSLVIRLISTMTVIVFGIAVCTTSVFAQKAYAEDCDMTVGAVWLQEFTVSAQTEGECGLNDVNLTIFNGAEEMIWSASYQPDDLFGFWEEDTPEAMETALSDWIVAHVDVTSTATLPAWSQADNGPEYREFPFYLAEDVDRNFYELARELDLPMVCYVQGQESTLCLFQVPGESQLEPIGYQSFPG
jgi:hypothetical protein